MRVLVAYASRTGFTKGIAQFTGERLREHGTQVNVQEVDSVNNPDALIVGRSPSRMTRRQSRGGSRVIWLDRHAGQSVVRDIL